jgi:glucokinase
VILAGDIGGTRARLSLFAKNGKTLVRHEIYESRAYASLEAVVREFLGKTHKVDVACFGIAGPVVGQRVTATNLPWVVDARVVARRLKIARVTLLNDLVALALGALTVPPKRLHVLQGGRPPKRKGGTLAVLAAGTGLGEAALFWNRSSFVPCGTEGGHTDFAPRTDLEMDLLRFLRARFGGHVSYERILSGNGIGNLYDFFREAKRVHETHDIAEGVLAATDRNAEITSLGLARKSEAAARALDLFASIYGAEAGNLALKMLATGGVYVAGGISVHLLPLLEQGAFVRAFVDKGRFQGLLETIPVAVVLDTDIGLAGSAYHALHGGGVSK